ncbi:unnamed protein product [Brassicogethes aeneus]|uniref:Exonuclease domain-containing protein n=1 Tax=Brassicogethes aeneus TaxID=1431903 RepID=A0A9P0B0J4_BRAAE|nr:unnamed protein product [Brassicogethes aeneus]
MFVCREYDAVQRIKVGKTRRFSKQTFEYFLVLDFEATCWDKGDYDKGSSEVIEFPCVLYDVKNNEIVDEFQQYVMPFEKPKLSPFCTNLTGIEQHQVENGVPLKTCLMLFNKWLNKLIKEHKLSFVRQENLKYTGFCTWSDWDLGTCLFRECKRKGIYRPEHFSRWIDVRAIYKDHYARRPHGLLGALTELGLEFEGRQHCGLHDARNTARLVGRMVEDGVYFKLTKDITGKR